MDSRDVFKKQYLNAAALRGRAVLLEIEDARVEIMPLTNDEKLVLFFKNYEQGLVLNTTNWSSLVDKFGFETGTWIGKRIELVPARVQFSGKTVDAIRIQVPEIIAEATAPVNVEEDIPF